MCNCSGVSRGSGICPFAFGIALGLTSAIAVLIWSAWVIYGGGTSMMMAAHPGFTLTWAGGLTHALWALLKGFVFGFVLILIYDLLLCCKKYCCKNKEDKVCGCCQNMPGKDDLKK